MLDLYDVSIHDSDWKQFKRRASQDEFLVLAIGSKYRLAKGRIKTPTIFSCTILVFITGLGAYAAPVLVGGKDFQTINPLIRALVYDSPSISIVLSVILGALTIGLLLIFTKIEKKGTYYSVSKTKGIFKKQKIENKAANVIVHILAYLLFVIYILPIIFIVIFSFTNAQTLASGQITLSSFTLDNYISVFKNGDTMRPLLISSFYSIVASVSVVMLVLFLIILSFKHKNIMTKVMKYVLLIPWLLPSTIIALGLVQTFNIPQPLVLNFVLVGTPFILIYRLYHQ